MIFRFLAQKFWSSIFGLFFRAMTPAIKHIHIVNSRKNFAKFLLEAKLRVRYTYKCMKKMIFYVYKIFFSVFCQKYKENPLQIQKKIVEAY